MQLFHFLHELIGLGDIVIGEEATQVELRLFRGHFVVLLALEEHHEDVDAEGQTDH